jgi:glycosyltransferase involved in cell wall biosynthesis
MTLPVSVIIPAYNREAYLAEAIRSVLEQTRRPEEIIVVDDGSTDRTGEEARSFGERIRYVFQENRGISSARNTGVEASRALFLAFLDSDDLWLPQKLEWQMDHLVRHPETAMVHGHVRAFLSPELEATDPRRIDTRCMPGLQASCVLIRREALMKAGPFDPAILGGEYIEWFSRAEDLGCTNHVLAELVTLRRVHLSNCVLDRKKMNLNYSRVVKTILDRRRASNRHG